MNKIQLQEQFKQETKYLRWYLNIIEKAQSQNRIKLKKNHKEYVYYENHHILPQSLFKEFSDLKTYIWNGVLLTAKEHFICHMCIWKHYKFINDTYGERKMSKAINMLCKMGEYNSKNYQYFKMNLADSVETKKRKSEVAKENYRIGKHKKMIGDLNPRGMMGKKQSEKFMKIRKDLKPMLGKSHTDDTKAQMSERALNRETVKCPYCGKEGKINGMKQWHFDFCEMNPNKKRHKERPPQIIVKCTYCGKEGQKSAMKMWYFENCKQKPL